MLTDTRTFLKRKMLHHLLPLDLWRFIGLKLDTFADRLRFRAVCKSWMPLLPSLQPPWLMLSESDPNELAEDYKPLPRGFVSLGDEHVYKINLPQLHRALCIGSTGNWIITINSDKKMSLINPFSRDQIQLPLVTTFDDVDYPTDEEDGPAPKDFLDGFIWKAVLSASPGDKGEDCIAVVLHHYKMLLSIARPGDASWTTVQTPRSIHGPICTQDVIVFKGCLYAITADAGVLVCNIGDGVDPPKLSFLSESFLKRSLMKKNYLVE